MPEANVKRALEELHPASYAWAVTCCDGNHAEAEDVLQASYLKVLEKRARFGGRSSLKTWFFAVVRRTAGERRRRRRVHRALLLGWARRAPASAPPPDPRDRAARSQRAARILDALSRLSRRQRQVLELVFYQELSIAEAAAVLGLSIGSARTHYARGKLNLSTALTQGGEDDR